MSLVQQAVEAIIRPPRREYNNVDIPLVYRDERKISYKRHPVNYTNERNQKIVGSIYVREDKDPMDGGPCVIYLHGNSSNQFEGQFLISNICSLGIALYLFDFAGCGDSDGDYISLGYYEIKDLNFLISQLNSTFGFDKFALWGRSMGAATAVLCRNPLVVCKVVDSTYSSLYEEVKAMASNLGVPGFLSPSIIWILSHLISNKSDFDLYSVEPLEEAKKPGNCPMIMCHATDDKLVPFEQGKQVFDAYSNPDKIFVKVSHGHNGRRGSAWISRALGFILDKFGIQHTDKLYVETSCHLKPVQHFKDIRDLMGAQKVCTTACL
ncbi:Clan SC, family S9, unassigned serine peptidase [Histomonas meleagridis]|uniref:Clan SC, family S9, unassigned serine peptidase n=1 Tax=Histomonas meleagridis TaxID=135588 RepID=UPI00355AAF7B|nr:Clan SC, family S9, unassigned serine peptidase [Histomonas meleagridis]KAH0804527.1 Clan SC, family S9, unassigned serine peptidase [Histomonas meleagridis]